MSYCTTYLSDNFKTRLENLATHVIMIVSVAEGWRRGQLAGGGGGHRRAARHGQRRAPPQTPHSTYIQMYIYRSGDPLLSYNGG